MITKATPALLSFVASVDALREQYRADSKFTYAARFGATFEIPAGSKFARVYSTETCQDGADGKPGETRKQIYAFVALADNTTKTLGTLKAGDVMKPATWKAPAKHARGNIFNPDNGLTTCNSYGPGYLR